jgi:murein endopeptidase
MCFSMRALVVALSLFAFTPTVSAATHHKTKHTKTKKRAARIHTVREHNERLETRGPATGQSVGAPWEGRLQHASELPQSDVYVIRRPQRAFGVATTIDFIQRAIDETLEKYPDVHELAIGDISQEDGGPITQHHSHQSGRDADIGFFYKEKPAGYPESFIDATPDNLDCAATFKLLESFLATADEDGGVQVVFMDFDVQGILYSWAVDHGVSERRLERIFQFPHGRGASEGMVRHEPNHANHMHVRFKCRDADSSCR